MSTEVPPRTVALIGNPNTGKSTLFTALCGVRQHTGNYPGVTVERKEGEFTVAGRRMLIVDLPGTYSLAPRSPDEMITVDVLLGRREEFRAVDAVLCIVDASNIERNLYLVSQVLDLGLPTMIVLNMIDVAEARGIRIDFARLAERLGVPVFPVQANRKRGLEPLKLALGSAERLPDRHPPHRFPEPVVQEVERLQALVRSEAQTQSAPPQELSAYELPHYLALRLMLDSNEYLRLAGIPGVTAKVVEFLAAAHQRLAAAGCPVPGIEAISRYQWVAEVLNGTVHRPPERLTTTSDRIDRVLTHRVSGSLIFVLMMALMFQLVFVIAEPARMLIDKGKNLLSAGVGGLLDDGPLRSLLVTGIIEGVGGVVVFLPQIFALFFCVAILEDCGYMSRAAYLMDRLMSRIGLNGKSFIPLLSSFACAIPGIMATRVIENPRDRLVTMLVAPLMSCSARVPVYFLLVSTFIPDLHWGPWLSLRGLVLFAAYALGTIVAIFVAMILKKTILRGETPPFVMELPSYKLPDWRVVSFRMLERGFAFVYRAGTLILAVSILVWAAAYFPHRESDIPAEWLATRSALIAEMEGSGSDERSSIEGQLSSIERQIDGEYLRRSYLGAMGRFIEPAVRPLGWDWKIGCAVIASFPAREVVVATLGVIYNLGAETDEQTDALHDALRDATWEGTDRRVFNVPVALSLLVFFALCAQCGSTLAVLGRETNSWRWPVFTFVYMTSLAYLGALIVYQLGSRWSGY